MPRRVTDRPTDHMFQTALNVLLWLHMDQQGQPILRDEISRVRAALYVAWTRDTSPAGGAEEAEK